MNNIWDLKILMGMTDEELDGRHSSCESWQLANTIRGKRPRGVEEVETSCKMDLRDGV